MAVPDTVESLEPNLFEAVPETRHYSVTVRSTTVVRPTVRQLDIGSDKGSRDGHMSKGRSTGFVAHAVLTHHLG